ncbi:AIR carboxylase family protein, partial [Patescibacteria group bacterium]|nr:AIR carboxylase family protein [Patescibacteria group bacterium]
ATVAINAAKNAGLLAVRILAAADPNVREKMTAYQEELRQTVERKAGKLREMGYQKYS